MKVLQIAEMRSQQLQKNTDFQVFYTDMWLVYCIGKKQWMDDYSEAYFSGRWIEGGKELPTKQDSLK